MTVTLEHRYVKAEGLGSNAMYYREQKFHLSLSRGTHHSNTIKERKKCHLYVREGQSRQFPEVVSRGSREASQKD